MVKMEATCSGWRHIRGNYMGGRTGLTDLATAGPMVAVWCLKIQQRDLRCLKFPISMLCADNQLLGRVVVSLITALEQTREFLCKANGAILHHVLVSLAFSTLSNLYFIAGKAAS